MWRNGIISKPLDGDLALSVCRVGAGGQNVRCSVVGVVLFRRRNRRLWLFKGPSLMLNSREHYYTAKDRASADCSRSECRGGLLLQKKNPGSGQEATCKAGENPPLHVASMAAECICEIVTMFMFLFCFRRILGFRFCQFMSALQMLMWKVTA